MTINTMQRQQIDATINYYFEEFQEAIPEVAVIALEAALDERIYNNRIQYVIEHNILDTVSKLRDLMNENGVEEPGVLGLIRENRNVDEPVNSTDVRVYIRERCEDHLSWAKIRNQAANEITQLRDQRQVLISTVTELTAEGLTKDEAIKNLDKQIADLIADRDQKIAAEKALADERIREREAGLQVEVYQEPELPPEEDRVIPDTEFLKGFRKAWENKIKEDKNRDRRLDEGETAIRAGQKKVLELTNEITGLKADGLVKDKKISDLKEDSIVKDKKIIEVKREAENASLKAAASSKLAANTETKLNETNKKLDDVTEVAKDTQASTDRLEKSINDFTEKAGVAFTVIGVGLASAAAAPTVLAGAVGAELAAATTASVGGTGIVSGIGGVLGGAGSVDAGKEVGKWASDYIKGSDKKSLGGRDR